MYKNYEECCLEVGIDIKAPPPELKQHWVAYVSGEAIAAKSMNDAMSKSSLYEHVTSADSQARHSEYFVNRKEKEALGFSLWKKYLREEYFYVPDSVYNVCYEEAEIDTGELGHEKLGKFISRYIHVLDRVKLIKGNK